jgi:ribonuclease BN (tRNA processing enzyme)
MKMKLLLAVGILLVAHVAFAQASAASHTQVVVLGTGTPYPDPERSGPAVAIVVNDSAYLVDCGVGVVRRAKEAEKAGIKALQTESLKIVFITHLHSDHTLGYPDLIFTPWIMERKEPLQAYGPRGLRDMTKHIEQAWTKDIRVRTEGAGKRNQEGHQVVAHEISPGVVYQDRNVKVTAFLVKHGTWDQAFGYRFDTPDRSIVVAGDTTPADSVVQACNGCDLLLHEVYNPNGEELKNPDRKRYFATFHTNPEELGDIATRAHPKLLLLYHQMLMRLPESELLAQVRRHYGGQVESAHDLGVY